MTPEITLLVKQQYGKEVAYPACDTSRLFAQLCRQDTLTERDIKLIQKLGYTINFTQPNLTIKDRL